MNKAHEQRVTGHVSGWKEYHQQCVCGEKWPCPVEQGRRHMQSIPHGGSWDANGSPVEREVGNGGW